MNYEKQIYGLIQELRWNNSGLDRIGNLVIKFSATFVGYRTYNVVWSIGKRSHIVNIEKSGFDLYLLFRDLTNIVSEEINGDVIIDDPMSTEASPHTP